MNLMKSLVAFALVALSFAACTSNGCPRQCPRQCETPCVAASDSKELSFESSDKDLELTFYWG